MDGDFEELYQSIESWQPSREGIRQRAVEWVASPQFISTFYDNAHVPANARDVLRQGVGAREAENIWSTVRDLGIQNADLLQKYLDLSRTGQVAFAHAVIVNPGLDRMPDKSLPCLFLVSDDQDSASVVTAGVLAAALGEMYSMEAGGPERPKTLKFLRDDDFHLLRRRPLPLDEVDGFAAVLLDMLMRKSWMPPSTLPFFPILISPERGGAAVQIPWYVVMGETPTPSDLEPGVWHEIAEMNRSSKVRAKRATGPAEKPRSSPAPSPMAGNGSGKRPFSKRILLLRILSILLVLGSVAKLVFIHLMESTNFESGALGIYQKSLLAKLEIETWERLTPGDIGMMMGFQLLPLALSLLALAGAFRRNRTMSSLSYVFLTLSGFGGGSLPLAPLAGLITSMIPDRKSVWN